VLKVSIQPPWDAIRITEKALAVRLLHEKAKFGWGGKSFGCPTECGSKWVRIIKRDKSQLNERTWTGEECASSVIGVPKPELLRSYRWVDSTQRIVWRADELTIVNEPAASSTPDAQESIALSDQWWTDLRYALSSLANHKTVRTSARQDLITRRISAYASHVNADVEEWTVAHGDLHWANLTVPGLYILDWEGWGVGPRGLDPATLWVFSLGVPSLAARVSKEFEEDLNTRSGKIAKLFMCIELLRMIDSFGDHPSLKDPITDATAIIARDL
jgi:hypothetical protein